MTDMVELLAGLDGGGEALRLIECPVVAGQVRVFGVPVAASWTREAATNQQTATRALVLRSGAADSAHHVIGTL